jgi:hypothetical protein
VERKGITPEFGEPIVFTVKCYGCGTKIPADDAYTFEALGDDEPVCFTCLQLLSGM